MVKLTRGNVAYDFKTSPFKETFAYEDGTIEYVFSSQLNKQRFITRLKENREKINTSLSNRFNMNIKLNKLADLKLYTQVEKRGFLIKVDGEAVECLDFLELVGMKTKMTS